VIGIVGIRIGEATERCVRRGSHTAVSSLEKAMLSYLDERNKDPKPFVWTGMPGVLSWKFIENASDRLAHARGSETAPLTGSERRIVERISDSEH